MTFRRDSPRGAAHGRGGDNRSRTRHRPPTHESTWSDGQRGRSGSSPPPVRSRWGRARREWGQNFFRSSAPARRFARQLDGRGPEAATVEIGPGSGRITQELTSPDRRLVAVEIDPDWAHRLREKNLPGLTVVNRDFFKWQFPRGPVRVIGNLPFGTGTTMLRRCLDLGPQRFLEGVFLLQEEYTRKRVGRYGGNLFNAQWAPWYEFRAGLRFARYDFQPAPRTDTATLLVSPRADPPVPWRRRADYQDFVSAVFETGHLTIGEAARKVRRGNPAAWLRAAGVPSGLRVKDLSPDQWTDLFLGLTAPPAERSPRRRT